MGVVSRETEGKGMVMEVMIVVVFVSIGFVLGVTVAMLIKRTLNAESSCAKATEDKRSTLNAQRWEKEGLNEEEVRRVQQALAASPETARCVTWLAWSVEEEAVRASADAKPADGGYAFALAKTAGMVCACRAIEDMWRAVSDGSMADGMKQEREEREKGERGVRRRRGEVGS